jgi:ribosomal protein L29
MKITEIRKMKTEELTKVSNEIREDIQGYHRQRAITQDPNVRYLRNRRKDLAKVLTVISEQLIKEGI